jgi:hypothetical protein
MKKTLLYLLLILLPALSACEKSSTGWIKGTIQDLTGLDGCGFVIQLEDQSYLEPVNLSDFASSATIVDDQKVWVKYKEVTGGSICMVGKIIEIKDLQDR